MRLERLSHPGAGRKAGNGRFGDRSAPRRVNCDDSIGNGSNIGPDDTPRLSHKNPLRLPIEQQWMEMQRQRRQMELHVRRTADLQAELDVFKVALQRAAPILQSTAGSLSNGNGRRGGAVRQLTSETVSSTNQT